MLTVSLISQVSDRFPVGTSLTGHRSTCSAILYGNCGPQRRTPNPFVVKSATDISND